MSMEQNLNKFLEELIQEVEKELDEATATGNVAGYNVPGAFSDGGAKDKKRKKKISTQFGMKIVGKMDEVGKGSNWAEKYVNDTNLYKKLNWYMKMGKGAEKKIKGKEFVIMSDGSALIWNTKTSDWELYKPKRIDKKTGKPTYESVNEAKYYITRNQGRGRGKSLVGGKEFKTFKDAEKEVKRLQNTQKGIPGGGSAYFVTDKKMNRLKESVNEAKVKRPVNRWLALKNDESMHAHKKMAMGLKELKYQLRETEKFFNWYNKIKTMNELDSDNYWKRTNKHIYKIKERLINIARTIQEIEK